MHRGPADLLSAGGRWAAGVLFGGAKDLMVSVPSLSPLARGDVFGWMLGADLEASAPRVAVTRRDFSSTSPLSERFRGTSARYRAGYASGYAVQLGAGAWLLSVGAKRWVRHGLRRAAWPLMTGAALTGRVLWDISAAWGHIGASYADGHFNGEACRSHNHGLVPLLVENIRSTTGFQAHTVFAGLWLGACAAPLLAACSGALGEYGKTYRERHVHWWLRAARKEELAEAFQLYDNQTTLVEAYGGRTRNPARWRAASAEFVRWILEGREVHPTLSGWNRTLRSWGESLATLSLWTGPVLGLVGGGGGEFPFWRQAALSVCAVSALSRLVKAKTELLAVTRDLSLGGDRRTAGLRAVAASCTFAGGVVAFMALIGRSRDTGEGPATLAGVTNASSWLAVGSLAVLSQSLRAFAATLPEPALGRPLRRLAGADLHAV